MTEARASPFCRTASSFRPSDAVLESGLDARVRSKPSAGQFCFGVLCRKCLEAYCTCAHPAREIS